MVEKNVTTLCLLMSTILPQAQALFLDTEDPDAFAPTSVLSLQALLGLFLEGQGTPLLADIQRLLPLAKSYGLDINLTWCKI